jgi:hypothetical protein
MFPNYNIKGKVENEKYKQRITNNLLNALKYRNMVYKKYLESIHNTQLQSKPVIEPVIEPVVVEPVIEPVVVEPVIEPVVVEPVIETVIEPLVEPVVVKPMYVTPNFYWNTI